MNYDFCGYVTKNDVVCTDGRVIKQNAFAHHDGQKVPLVWNHEHGTVGAILGHVILENRPDGVYGYGSFNNSLAGQDAREAVAHGDVDSLSIWANGLREKKIGSVKEVMHGVIREVSLVLAGANPGAHIMDVSMAHGEDAEFEAQIFSGESLDECCHSADTKPAAEDDTKKEEPKEEKTAEKKDEDNGTIKDVVDSMTEEQKKVMYALIANVLESDDETDTKDSKSEPEPEVKHSADAESEKKEGSDRTVKDVIDSMNEKQKKVMTYLIAKALDEKKNKSNTENGENKEGESEMKHNAFDNNVVDETVEEGGVMQHSMDDIRAAIADGKKYGSMRDAFLAHGIDDLRVPGTETYGVKGISALYPDAKNVTNQPVMIDRDQAWVSVVMSGVKHTPFARIKTVFADITADEARAKGYTKGKRKIEEVFSLLKRITNPTTIYKKQKIDRDDMLDITEFDAVAWMKGEMRGKLDEEKARAILVGDGRNIASDDKIDEQCIRPIWTDNDLFTIKANVTVPAGADERTFAREFIKTVVKSRKEYKGSGNPTLFTTEDMLAALLLIEDKNERFIYTSEAQLAAALRVKNIVTVPAMEGLTNADGNELLGIIVNLNDYNVGKDKNADSSFFEDFDIDYNAMKYLIETRFSGALVKPFSAIAFHKVEQGA